MFRLCEVNEKPSQAMSKRYESGLYLEWTLPFRGVTDQTYQETSQACRVGSRVGVVRLRRDGPMVCFQLDPRTLSCWLWGAAWSCAISENTSGMCPKKHPGGLVHHVANDLPPGFDLQPHHCTIEYS